MPDAAFRREARLRGVIPNPICSELERQFEKSFIGKAGIRRIAYAYDFARGLETGGICWSAGWKYPMPERCTNVCFGGNKRN